ncbi:MAG: type II toxin-antitoxin system HicA family toxin [Bacteroidales bacterium]|nr:type II toxin-antitoxin system HicA family toxin [Bacteroidales bacterium]
MKQKDLIKHLRNNGCYLLREGKKHMVYFNPLNKKTATVPRHKEIKNILCKEICKELEIEMIG